MKKLLIFVLVILMPPIMCGFTWSESDAEDIAKVIYKEGNHQTIYGKSLIVWCILNRVDHGYADGTIHGVVSAKHQFAYRKSSKVTEENLAVAKDVLTRWEIEKQFGGWVGRTLPSDYLWFAGHDGYNWFRNKYKSKGKSHVFDNVDLYDHEWYVRVENED